MRVRVLLARIRKSPVFAGLFVLKDTIYEHSKQTHWSPGLASLLFYDFVKS